MTSAAGEQFNSVRGWSADLVGYAAAGVAFGIVGPFGTFLNGPVLIVLGYWIAVLVFAGLIMGLLVRWSTNRLRHLPWWIWMAGILFASVPPLAIASRSLATLLWPGVGASVGWLEWHGQTLVISVICLSLYSALRHQTFRSSGACKGEPKPSNAPGLLLNRLRRKVICLQMEDHYVRLHSRSGSTLLLMPLGEAIAQLNDVEGMQVHRSWWVARHAVQYPIRDGRNLRLRLKTGLEAPVARSKVAMLRSAGWLSSQPTTIA